MGDITVGHAHSDINSPMVFLSSHQDPESHLPVDPSMLQYSEHADLFVRPQEAEDLKRSEDTLFSGCEEELKSLHLAIRNCRKNSDSMTARADENITCTWSDVSDEIQRLAETDKPGDRTTRLVRRLGDNAEAFQNWLTLLPNGDYGGAVSGVFALLLGAAKRASDVRGSVYTALADIPDWIRNAADYRDIYKSQKPTQLIKLTAELCSALLIALRLVVQYFGESSLKNAFKAIGRGGNYKNEMIQALERVKMLTMKINSEALICGHRRQQSLERKTEAMNKRSAATQLLIYEGFAQMQSESYTQNFAEKVAEYVLDKMGVMVNNYYNHLVSNPDYDHSIGRLKPRPLHPATSSEAVLSGKTSNDAITKPTLIRLLRSSTDLARKDLQRCLNNANSLSLVNLDRVKWTMRSSVFRQWLTAPNSRALLVSDNDEASETFSSMTFLSAKLLATLQDVEPVISIHYFCSLHTSPIRDKLTTASGLLKSLLVQILMTCMDWDLSFLDQKYLTGLKNDKISVLCKLFHELVKQLPRQSFLFCIVDAITFYESADKRDDFLATIKQLLKEVNGHQGVIIKLLLTCTGHSAFVKKLMGPHDVLRVDADIDSEEQGLSEAAWTQSMNRQIEELRNSVTDS